MTVVGLTKSPMPPQKFCCRPLRMTVRTALSLPLWIVLKLECIPADRAAREPFGLQYSLLQFSLPTAKGTINQ